MTSRPLVQLFGERQFIFRPRGRSFGQALPFDWEPVGSTLPSLRGSITMHRFGPVVLLVVDARFEVAHDAAGQILRESVGRQMAQTSMRYLSKALYRVVTTTVERVPAHR
jgi:hypothetical protein